MMPGSKGLSPHELAHKWVKDLLPPTSTNLNTKEAVYQMWLIARERFLK